MAPHWLLYWGHTEVRTCVIDGPVSGDRGPSPSLSSCGASDTQRHPGCSGIFVSKYLGRVGLNEQRNGPRNSSEDAPRGESNHRCTVSLLISPFSHCEHHATFFSHSAPNSMMSFLSSLPDASASITLSIPLLALFFYWHMLMHICQWRNSFWLPITAGDWSSSTDVPIP